MSGTDNSRVYRRLELLVARAVAQHQLRTVRQPAPMVLAEFLPLAAAGEEAGVFGEIAARNDPAIRMRLEVDDAKAVVTIWTIGFSRTQEVRTRPARLISRDARAQADFRFDGTGCGVVHLPMSAQTLRSLQDGTRVELI